MEASTLPMVNDVRASKARFQQALVGRHLFTPAVMPRSFSAGLTTASTSPQARVVHVIQTHLQGAMRRSKVALFSSLLFFAVGLGKTQGARAAAVAATGSPQQQVAEASNTGAAASRARRADRRAQVEVRVAGTDTRRGMVEAIVGHGHGHGHGHASNTPQKAAHTPAKATAAVSATNAGGETEGKSALRKFFSFQREIERIEKEAGEQVKGSVEGLLSSLRGVKQDTLLMLVATSIVIPIFKRFNLSPILGFLAMGTFIGHAGMHWVHDEHTIDMLGDLGIVFFLFEMGLELSIARLKSMKKDVFGLGSCQFGLTAAAGTAIAVACGLPAAAAVTIGGSVALSSSAFVLQLLKDKDTLGTRHGRASFGVLLLQDLAVVPLLVIVELLSKGGAGLGKALAVAGVKAVLAVSSMSFLGRRLLDPIFQFVAKSRSQEAFIAIILTTVLLMSFVTQGIGLSNTLGAFLAGLLLAETKYKYQVEADIAPFRGLLLGFFFITVGFNIDLGLIAREAPRIGAIFVALIAGKAAIITALCLAFGMSLANAQHTGLLLAQGGEFAFVALGIADRTGLIESNLCKVCADAPQNNTHAFAPRPFAHPLTVLPVSLSPLPLRILSLAAPSPRQVLMTTVALSMAATPALAELGQSLSERLDNQKDMSNYIGQDQEAAEMKSYSNTDFVFVSGYGRVGKMVCDMLDRIGVKYIAVDSSPQVTIEARQKGLPVFYGDINRPEVLRNFNVGASRACVFATDDQTATNKAVITVRQMYPKLPLVVRAKNVQHKRRLEEMFTDLSVMTPTLPEDSVLLTLPFGGAVLQNIGVSKPEIDGILEEFRQHYMEDRMFDSKYVV